jgi:hypothetical protein
LPKTFIGKLSRKELIAEEMRRLNEGGLPEDEPERRAIIS